MEEKKTESMLCPITKEIMVDPVKASDGVTYEGEVIRQLITDNPGTAVSPVTGELLTDVLVPNTELKKIIEETIASAAQALRVAKVENPRLAERIQQIEAEAGAGNDPRFQFSTLPKDLRRLISLDYFRRLPLSDRKRLAELGNPMLTVILKKDIERTNAKVQALLGHVVKGSGVESPVGYEDAMGHLIDDFIPPQSM